MVGEGGQGQAWLAWKTGDEARAEPVVVTVIPGAGPAVAEAARRVAQVSHSGVAPVLDVVEDHWGVAVVTPYHRTGTLRDLLVERGVLGIGELTPVLVELAQALEALHRAGIVHGDLHPGNVILTESGSPLLIDVGVAAVQSPTPAAHPAYLDPRSVATGVFDPASDLFSLGVVAYEALSGRAPHRGTPREILAAAGLGAHPRLGSWPGVDERLATVVESALAPAQEDRPPNLAAFVSALVGCAARSPQGPVGFPRPARTSQAPEENRAGRTVEFDRPWAAVDERPSPGPGPRRSKRWWRARSTRIAAHPPD